MIRQIARREAERVAAAVRADVHRTVDAAVRRAAGPAVTAAVASDGAKETIHAVAADTAAYVATAAVRLNLTAETLVPLLEPELTRVAARVAREEAAAALPPVVQVVVGGAAPRRVEGPTHAALTTVLAVLGAGLHAVLVGPAGTGKSTLAQQAAHALGLELFAMSVGPATPPSKMFGYQDAHGGYHRTPLRDAYERGGLMLLDELDNGHPGVLTELNQALSLDVCAFPDGMVRRHDRFRLVATANTFGFGGDRRYVGRQALDAATLDRLVTVEVGIDEQLEARLVHAHAPTRPEEADRVLAEVRRLRRIADEKQLPLVFSPRAGIHAARLLQRGARLSEAIALCVTGGLSPAHRAALGLPTR